MISVKNISKTYKIVNKEKGIKGAVKSLFIHNITAKTAVNNVSFEISKGEIVGYIGTNGAGKSTTIKMMTGILTPDTGQITVNNIVPYQNRIENAKNIGVVFGQRSQLSWDIPVRESFHLLHKIYGIDKQDYQNRLEYLTDILDLKNLMQLPVRQMSLGQKMRCELASCFLHNPAVVYLDEPTIGLDVDVKDRIRKFILDINKKQNTTIVLTTHDMQDIEQLCKRVIIIDEGNIIYDGNIDNLKKSVNEKTIIFECASAVNNIYDCSFPDGTIINIEKNTAFVTFNPKQIQSSIIIDSVLKKLQVSEISIKEPSIETIIQRIYRKEIRLQ